MVIQIPSLYIHRLIFDVINLNRSPKTLRPPAVTQQASMTASNTVFTVFSGIGLTLSVIPLWWHLESRNVGTCMYMIWTALACLVQLVNSIVWDGNTVNRAPVWCDIGTPRCSFAQFLHLMIFIQPSASK